MAITATTFFPSKSTADKAKIQALLDNLAAGAHKDTVLTGATQLGAQMGGADRDQLMSIVYQQLAAR